METELRKELHKLNANLKEARDFEEVYGEKARTME